MPIHAGNGHELGETAGSSSVTVNQQQMPQHQHVAQASANDGTTLVPSGNVLFGKRVAEIYHSADNLVAMNASTVSNVGGSQPHNNMRPYLCVNFIIACKATSPAKTKGGEHL